MKKKTTISILMLLLAICMYGQKNGSIYEVGDSIVNCETNFKNLMNNWTTDNITNADEYKSFRYAFVETITDSIRYNYYRNLLSGDEMLSASKGNSSGEKNGHKYHTCYIKPRYVHSEFYDTSNMTEKQKTIWSDDFRQKAKELLTRDLNIDKMILKHYSFSAQNNTTKNSNNQVNSYDPSKKSASINIVSPDSISANYIDVFIWGKKTTDQFDITEMRRLLLEQLLIERTGFQLMFNMQVHLEDKLYAVRFEYLGKQYTNYVICSSKTKKVVFDSFFDGINAEQPKVLVRAIKVI